MAADRLLVHPPPLPVGSGATAAEARARGRAVVGGSQGAHLDIATRPAQVADLLG
jgi:hypothetical protein